MAEHWRLKPEVPWVQLPMTASLFTFLYFRLITSKFPALYGLTVSETRLECKVEQVGIVSGNVSGNVVMEGIYTLVGRRMLLSHHV